jgi:hypothetical protein
MSDYIGPGFNTSNQSCLDANLFIILVVNHPRTLTTRQHQQQQPVADSFSYNEFDEFLATYSTACPSRRYIHHGPGV